MFYPLTKNPAVNVQLMNRYQREVLGSTQETQGARRRPQPVRNLTAAVLAKAILLSWMGPANLAGITGYNVYQGSQSNLVQNVPAPPFPSASSQGSNISPSAPPSISATISGLASGTPLAFWVSAYTALLESVKTQVIATPS